MNDHDELSRLFETIERQLRSIARFAEESGREATYNRLVNVRDRLRAIRAELSPSPTPAP